MLKVLGFRPILLAILILVTPIATSMIVVDFQRFHTLMASKYGSQKVQVSRQWEQLIRQAAHLSDQEKIAQVNRFVHRNVRYMTDMQLYGQEDYWATPLETFGQGLGDCEDYAIAKYVTLRAMGMPDDKLRLIYVRAKIAQGLGHRIEAHMVLGYYATPNAEPLILDSLIPEILPASQRPDLTPVFSFNAQGLWAGNQRANQSPTARLSRWRSVLDRMAREGIAH
ncbi:transglutaminase-like cysteine peptidase [Thiomicrospira microaerophila]|uniref:transglutaminase-like cysteine peptidase n=1 Tax=Thiomicrospira microaerophila TaxID=406020 RepID=UPI00200DF5DC|nr:transglutaminase-like cysteine peptidase [Thiomicrospira microaerophila]UQB41519.1 transglutaminase-like cysteine peptidase [Thiomicrospira microaerophila]